MVMIGVDPHKGSHTAVASTTTKSSSARCKVRASDARATAARVGRDRSTTRTWAIESADGLGYLLAQQLVAAGETVARRARHPGGTGAGVGHRPLEQERPQRRPLGGGRGAACAGDDRRCDARTT